MRSPAEAMARTCLTRQLTCGTESEEGKRADRHGESLGGADSIRCSIRGEEVAW